MARRGALFLHPFKSNSRESVAMIDLYRLYQTSPEEFCAELDKALSKIQQIDAKLYESSGRVESLALLYEAFLKTTLSRQLITEPANSWTYDARLPNRYFKDSVFPPERRGNGFLRWVRNDGRLAAKIVVSRVFQYNFAISIADFVSPEAEASFALRVDGTEYPWISADARVFKTIILEDPDSSELDFELFVDPGTVPEGKDTSFSFFSIDINRRA
jgi:hypothetical protein